MMDVTSDARAVGYGRDQILEHGATVLVHGTWAKSFQYGVFSKYRDEVPTIS
jgi:hypothetical protein